MPASISGLYIHIPFCFHKCHYCDFYSIVADPQEQGSQFIDRLIRELDFHCRRGPIHPKNIFLGGGTPTYLPADTLAKLFKAMQTMGLLQEVQEFTVEANPETLDQPMADTLADGGVNRLSIGTQSFNRQLLEMLERWHDPDNIAPVVKTARRAGIDNINLDLIFAIPGQTTAMLEEDLDSALSLNPDHISCYNLTYEPATALTKRLEMGLVEPVEQEEERQMYQTVMDRLDQAGFTHYEISSWARPDRQCKHNLMYWHNENWLGVGPSAASHFDGLRWKNQANLGKYIDAQDPLPAVDIERLEPDRRIGELLMLGLRLRQGMSFDQLDKLIPEDDRRWPPIEKLIELGMLERHDQNLRLSHEGLFVADAVISTLL